MKTIVLFLLSCFLTAPAFALSITIDRDINFPKDYSPERVAAIRKVIQDPQFHFVEGTASYWPPDWGTTLSYTGDAKSLNAFIEALRQIPGIGLRLKLYRGQNTELHRDSPWQLYFSHARPDELTLQLNLNATQLEFDKLALPLWPALK